MQRVRIGLMGLAVVFLLVLLAAAFVGLTSGGGDEIARPGDATGQTGNIANVASASDPKEPLAELGVAPGGATEVGNLVAPPAEPVTIPAPAAPALAPPPAAGNAAPR